jgi:hypothetical protein
MKINRLILTKLLIVVLLLIGQILYSQEIKSNEFKLGTEKRSPKLGEGYDSRNGDFLTNRAFDGINDNQSTGSVSSGKFIHDLAVSSQQDFEMSGYDAKISGHYLAFNGKGELNELSMFATSSFDVVWYISYECTYTTPQSLSNPSGSYSALTQALIKKENGGKEFLSQYGDRYVSSITMGHKIIIRYTYNASTNEEKKEFSALVSAHLGGLLASGDMSAQMSKISQKYNNSMHVSSEFIYQAPDEQRVPPMLDALIKKEFDFDTIKNAVINYVRDLNSSNATCISFELSPYPDLPANFFIPDFDEELSQQFTERYFEVSGQLTTLKQVKAAYLDDISVVKSIDKQIKLKHSYLLELVASGKAYFSHQNPLEKIDALNKFQRNLDTPLISIHLPGERIWQLRIAGDLGAPVNMYPGLMYYAYWKPFSKNMAQLILGHHSLRIVGSVVNQSPSKLDYSPTLYLECSIGEDIISINGSSGLNLYASGSPTRYHFDVTVPFTPSSRNPSYFSFKVYCGETRVTYLILNTELEVTFIK